MKNRMICAMAAVGLLVGLCGGYLYAQSSRPAGANPCLEPYMPTKIEWMRVALNANMKTWHQAGQGTFLIAFGGNGKDTIELRVVHGPQVDQAYMNLMIDEARYAIRQMAKNLGIEPDLKITENVRAID